MRLSADQDDAGYGAYRALLGYNRHVNVYLDGVKMERVQTADDEAGVLVRYVTDARGNLVLRGTGEGVVAAKETLYGQVVIEISDLPPRGWS